MANPSMAMVAPSPRLQAMGVANAQAATGGLPVSAVPTTAGASPLLTTQAAPALPITANTTMTATGLPVRQSTAGAPPTGLIGSEAALQSGYNDASGMMTGGYNAAAGAIGAGYDAAAAGLADFSKGLDSRQLNLNTSLGGDSVNAINQGVAAFDPYTQGGSNAQKLYDDMTGVNGPEAQSAAQSAYQSSPALQYQMDQMQKATERSAAARGGLMSGSVLQELQRNAQGLASQDYFKNLGAVGESANRGLNAASGVAGLRGQQAQMSSQLQGIGLQAQANYEMQKEQTRTDIAKQLAGLSESRGLGLANIAESKGVNSAGLRVGLSQEQAAGRERAGVAMGQNATQAASNIAQYLNQQGVGVSDMMNKDISSITDFMYQSGMQDKADMQNLADLIARINGAEGANVMQGNQALGAAGAAGALGVGNAVQQGVQQGIATGLIGGK